MTEPITLNLTLEELKMIDKYVELNDDTQQLFDKIKNAYPQQRMTDTQKLEFLLKELKSTAKRKTCYEDRDWYEYSDDHDATFDDGDRYGKITFARELLENMGESYA